MGVTMTADEHDAAEPVDSGASTADDGAAPVASSDSPPEFREFFTQAHVPMVRSLSLALHDDQLGRDAAAEGFARALARWSSVATMANPAGWVYRVGLNWARSRRRKHRREVSVARLDDRPGVSPDNAASDIALRRALGRLSDDHRDVVVARYFLDWPESQIAESLGIAPGTVKSRLSRALHQLELDLGEPTPATPAPEGPDHD